ncbi:MAG TPA: DUF1631 family protein [Rudaea sp.]|nr:DUF1631 family protein [Rudaea sp.]
MIQGASTFGAGAVARQLPRKKLSQRHDLPPRVRHMLTGVLGLCTGTLANSLVAALNEFEQVLAKRAAQARTGEQSRRFHDTLREVRRARADVGPRFLTAIEDGIARFDLGGHPGSSDPAPGAAQQPDELALVEKGDLEESLAVQEIVTRSEIRQALALHDLGSRFAVLVAQPAFDVEQVPLGPARIIAALRYACAGLDIPAEHRVLLYRAYDHAALSEVGTFYAALNAFFVEHRILRHLRVLAPLRPRAKGGSADEAHAAEAARAQGGDGKQPPPPGTGTDQSDPELFTTLRELLAGRRPTHAVKPVGRRYVASADDLQSVLGKLQSKPVLPPTSAGKVAPRSVTHLKQDLLDQLHQLSPSGQHLQLSSEDSDTIDLVGMLFDYIEKSAPAKGRTQTMLAELQVPLLRVALRDKSFFTHGSHPARLLLNAIAETGIHWIDESEGESDPVLLKKMHLVIERLNAEFDGDLSLIERMLGDLSQHMHVLAHKAEVAERRLVDASKGREKLALARETAGNAIAERVAAARPGRLLRTMLEQAWTDVLALTLLRHGENSVAYARQLQVADQLIAAGSSARATGKPPVAALRQEVEKGLGQVGFHHDEIQAVVRHLLAPEEAAREENPESQTQIAMRLKAKTHLGHSAGEEKPMRAAALRKAALKLNAQEEQVLEHLKTVPYGTWFEFATNQQGDRVRRKLSWYSTVTGRCLFVNQRGARAYERTLEQLARDVVRGQANIAAPEQGSLVDRAWKAIVNSLRQLTGRGADAPLVPA